jgi:hypothetical protein
MTAIRVKSKDPDQRRLEQAVRRLSKPEDINFSEVFGVDMVVATDIQIHHGLGRQPKHWWLLDIDANRTVWRVGWDNVHLTLRASGTCTIAVRIE